MKITPTGTRLHVKRLTVEDKGTIVTLEEHKENQHQSVFEVLTVSEDVRDDYPALARGCKVFADAYCVQQVDYEGEDYLFLSVEDVFAIVA